MLEIYHNKTMNNAKWLTYVKVEANMGSTI